MSGAEIQAEYSYVLTNGLKPNGMAKPVSRDEILRREQGQGKKHFLRSGGREQDWQPYLVDPHSAESADLYNVAILPEVAKDVLIYSPGSRLRSFIALQVQHSSKKSRIASALVLAWCYASQK